MKKFLLALLVVSFCLQVTQSISQSCAPKGISTDPLNPVNPDPNGRINTFNYTATGWPLRTEYLANDTYKQSPFYSDNNSAIEHLYAPNDGVLDILPANGWEVIKRDFGYQDDGQPSPEKAKNPFIVLYNRYTGKLRVFVARYSQQSFNGATIVVKFIGNSPMQTSLFDLGTKLKAIDAAFNWDQNLNSVVNFPSGPFEWFYSDFQMQYDPCTCFFTSKLEIILKLSNTATVTLSGSSTGTITAGAPTQTQNDKGPISFGDFINGSKKGIQAYKSGVTFLSDMTDAINTEGGAKKNDRLTGLTNLVNALKTNQFLKAGLSSIPFASDVLTVINLFNGGGKTGPQQVTVTPMAIRQSYDFTGVLTSEYPNYTTITFRNPGSAIGDSPLSQYPYYNEVMGVFNLLKTPKFKRTIINNGGGNYTAKFTLADDAEYVLNPAAKLNIQEILSFVLIKANEETKMVELRTTSPDVSINYVQGGPTPTISSIMVVLNLSRQNTNTSTQNILLSLQYPTALVTTVTKTGAKLRIATNLDTFCNSTVYKNSARFPAARIYEDDVKELEKREWEEELKKNEINEKKQGDSINIYPNPGTDKIHIDYNLLVRGPVRISLTNSMGSVISTLKDSQSIDAGFYQEEFNIADIQKGIYHLKIEVNGQTKVQKIVINR